MFSKACSLICQPYVHAREVENADELLMSFCTGVQTLYGNRAITRNMHLHGHLKECILDVGPLYSFWCFSFERYNGILEKMKKSWHAPEQQLIHKFSNLQTLASTVLPPNLPLELSQVFTQVKQYKTALPDAIISGLIVFKYEQNLMYLPHEVSAVKECFQHMVPPGREKYIKNHQRQDLMQMYCAIYGIESVVHVPPMHQPHVLASVKWYQEHPQKYYFGNGIVLSATVPENTSCSSYIPVSRILSKCSYIHTKVKFSYGEDNVCVAIPLKRHNLF